MHTYFRKFGALITSAVLSICVFLVSYVPNKFKTTICNLYWQATPTSCVKFSDRCVYTTTISNAYIIWYDSHGARVQVYTSSSADGKTCRNPVTVALK